ncbi:MAG: hypothetical protein LBS43_08670 [Prevotellaceae bacterium]|nr:hypothetical protein [Prevotellaceae bacterium]
MIFIILVCSALNKNGEKVENPFKSSLFRRSVGIEALEKRIKSKSLRQHRFMPVPSPLVD